MSFKKNFRLVIFLIFFLFVAMIYYTNIDTKEVKLSDLLELPKMFTKTDFIDSFRIGYAISTPSCKMLDPNPWDKSIKKYISNPRPLVCSSLPLLTYVEQLNNFSYVLKINTKVIKKYKVSSIKTLKCCYSVITRISQSPKDYNMNADKLYELSNCTNFKEQVLLPNNTEFIEVSCQGDRNGKSKKVYKDVHPVVPILPKVSEKMKKIDEKRKTESLNSDESEEYGSNSDKLNVMLLGIDSVSRLNFRRIMPRTLKFLQQNDWVELNGYNKIGENTFPNLMAILNGRSMEELNDLCWTNRSQKMDVCPSIWKEYDKKDYITMYAEDTPAISTFNLQRTGFVEKPTDYYLRPFMLAAHDTLSLKNIYGLPVCLGQVLIVDHVFNYAKRFLRTFNNYNHFTLLWLNSLSHNDVNAPKVLDNSVSRFLADLKSIGTYNNTLIIFLSDHGVRFGNIRETFLGYLEERIPFIFLWFPDCFKEKYPEKYSNLLINQNRLTSPYEVHVTLKKLLSEETEIKSGPISKACPKCNGLLETIPINRTCAEAGIDVNWCMCSEFRAVDVKDPIALQIGKFLYNYIKYRTDFLAKQENINKHLCSEWKFFRVFRADEILPQDRSIRSKESDFDNYIIDISYYVIIIELNPGKTKFEATIQMTTNSSTALPNYTFLEFPKRLDSIYKTSNCVNNTLLKHYCYCKKK